MRVREEARRLLHIASLMLAPPLIALPGTLLPVNGEKKASRYAGAHCAGLAP